MFFSNISDSVWSNNGQKPKEALQQNKVIKRTWGRQNVKKTMHRLTNSILEKKVCCLWIYADRFQVNIQRIAKFVSWIHVTFREIGMNSFICERKQRNVVMVERRTVWSCLLSPFILTVICRFYFMQSRLFILESNYWDKCCNLYLYEHG